MMSSTVNLIEVIDDKYILNEKVLQSIKPLTQGCSKIALISIIGPKNSGKSFLINCLLNYLESNERESWPQKSSIFYNYGFQTDYKNTNPVIRLSSKPLILENENEKIAIFLMDSSHVFTDISEISKTKLMEDIIGLFMFTSSTVVYSKRFLFASEDLKRLQESLAKNLDFIKSVDSYQELFFFIQDWNSKYAEKSYLYGLKGGKDYINNESEGLEVQKFFTGIECYLMPEPGTLLNKPFLNFSILSDQFNLELSKMVKTKLFNTDEMQIKTKPNTNSPIKSNELIELFEIYIDRLNADSNKESISNDLEKSKMNPTISANSQKSTVIIHFKKKSITEEDLDKQYNCPIESVDSELKIGDQVLQLADLKLNQTPVADNRTQHQSGANDLSGVQTDTCMNTSHSAINATKDGEIGVSLNQTVINVKNETTECFEKINVITHTKDDEILEFQKKLVMSESDTYFNLEENASLDKKIVEEASENIAGAEVISQVEISNFCQRLLNEYRKGLENASKDLNFDFENGLSKAHDYEKSKSMSTFKNDFEDRTPSELYNEYRKLLSDEMNIIKYEIKKANNEQINELRNKYEIKLNTAIKSYNKEMGALLECHLKLSTQILDLVEIHNKSKQISIQSFGSEVKEIIGFNMKLSKDFSNKLEDKLNVEKKKYEKAFDLIKNYRNEWKNYYNIYRYISLDRLLEIEKDLGEKIGLSLDELKDQELKQITVNWLQNIFVSIQKKNEDINKQELALAEDVVNLVFNLFCERLNSKLKSGLFSLDVVKQMHKTLVEYNLQTMITGLDYREDQKHLNEKCENDFKNKVQQNYTKMTSEYLKISTNAKSVLQKARDETINKYNSQMERTLSEKPYFKQNEFETISSRLSNDAMKMNEELVESLKNNFNPEFYQYLVSENIADINKKVIILKDKFAKQNDKNAPKVTSIAIYFGRYYLSAANFDKEIRFILDKNENKSRPNSIAFSDKILFGYEAKTHNEELQSDKELFDKNFDIKQLIAKSRKKIRKEKLNSYPFEFLAEKLRVKVNNDLIKHDFPIESLIALQVLDIKLDAEKQLGNSVTNAVLTVPTYFNLRQRNAFRDVAKIAGLEEVYLLSEMSAAAISYATDINRVNRQSMSSVFFVIINEFECDTAVINFKDINIEYKSYYHQNLTSHIENKYLKSLTTLKSFFKAKNVNEEFSKALKNLFGKTLHNINFQKKFIDTIVIAGNSILFNIIKKWTADYFESDLFFSCDPFDVIINGSAIFSQMMTNYREHKIDIKEITLYPISYIIEGKYFTHNKLLIQENQILPTNKVESYNSPALYNLPLSILIIQDKTVVSLNKITSLPPEKFGKLWWYHEFQLSLNKFGEINLSSRLSTSDRKTWNDVNIIETKLGLTEEEIIKERNIIAFIELQFKDKHKLTEETSAIIQAKNYLETYYLEVKKSVEDNSSLRGPKLKKIKKELEITLQLLNSNDNDVNKFSHQTLRLKQYFEILYML